MVFSSPVFLFMFLPIVLTLYFLVPKKFQNLILTIASLYFYAFGEKFLVIIMALSTVVGFYSGTLIEQGKAKLGLYLSIAVNLGFLGFFKYFNFTFDNFHSLIRLFGFESSFFDTLPHIALPIGISFYVFQTLSYTIDVYRGDVKANKNLIEFATYVTMFPQLVAGPIVRYIDIQAQIGNKELSYVNFRLGLERLIIGLTKKMIIANTFAAVADNVFNSKIDDLSTLSAWIGVLSYTIQIYFDFSGYSDMAIGLGKMFGFHFLENFNYPYISNSIKEFWRRWHISLSSWFRDYLYIPLGGNKKGRNRTYINLFIVFFVTGLWHGASWNFVVWGLFHGFFIIIERLGFDKILNRFWKPIQHIYTLLIVIIGWVFFRATDLHHAIRYLSTMFTNQHGNEATTSYLNYFYLNNEFFTLLLVAVLFSLPVFQYVNNFMNRKELTFIRPIIYLVLFIISLAYVAASSYNPFIYFKF